ncbi:hypothetical protein [Tenacibaculum sp. nBUS_03]|uniref:hypothetical protein n=1 Tax=Tenacibaculum sp. nBUS_03 TaxID=3395320 RepID=UPI003EC034D1
MSTPIQNSTDLLSNIKSNKLYNDLINQLNKDLSLTGNNLHFSQDYVPLTLKKKLQAKIKELIINDFDLFTSLLYRIDVSENDIQKIESTNIDLYAQNITFLILKRTWKKVLFKDQYREK